MGLFTDFGPNKLRWMLLEVMRFNDCMILFGMCGGGGLTPSYGEEELELELECNNIISRQIETETETDRQTNTCTLQQSTNKYIHKMAQCLPYNTHTHTYVHCVCIYLHTYFESLIHNARTHTPILMMK